MSTSAVDVSIHATSPLFGVGAGAAVAEGAAAAGAAAGAAGAAAGAGVGAGAGVAAGAGAALSLSCPTTGAANASAPNIAIIAKTFFIDIPLECVRAGLAGTNAHDLQQVEDKDLAVADLARIGGFFDGLDNAIEQVVLDGRFDLHLGQEV